MFQNTKIHCLIKELVVLMMTCLSFSSCSPWDSELEEIYEAAQNGDRLSRFAIIEEHNSFDDIVPEETMQAYLWEFVKEGNPRAIELGAVMDLKKLDHRQSKKYLEQSDKIDLKWDYEGVKYDNYLSYKHLADRQMEKYRKTGYLQDSLKAEELYKKSIEAGNRTLRLERDVEAGLKAVIAGGIELGKFSYANTFKDNLLVTRVVFSCSYAYAYIVGGAMKLLFTASWWKVLLLAVGMLLLLLIPLLVVIRILGDGSERRNEVMAARSGIIFGFWNSMCFFTAVSRKNIVWLNNTTSLLFPPSAYGLQQYLSIAMNWVALITLIVIIYRTIKDGREDLMNPNEMLRSIVARVVIFIFAYLIAQIGGYLILIILLVLAAVPLAAGVVVSAPAAITDDFSDYDDSASETSADNEWDDDNKTCSTCYFWDSTNQSCPYKAYKVSWNDRCNYWR